MSDKHHHHHHKRKESESNTGVYTGHPEETPLLEGGGSGGGEGGCFQAHRTRNILFLIVFIVVVIAVAAGAIFLTLPATYSCNEKDASYYITVVKPPTVDKADPPVVCAAHMTPIILHGTQFIEQDANTIPNITALLGSKGAPANKVKIENISLTDCNSLHIRSRDFKTCKQISFSGSFPNDPNDESYSVTLEIVNPEAPKPKIGSSSNGTCQVSSKILTVIPSPTVDNVDPQFICLDGDNSIDISGSYFIQARKKGASADSMPSFTICNEEVKLASGADGCEDLPSAAGYDYIRSCSDITLETTAASCTPGTTVDISITNPDPGSCPASYPSMWNLPVTEKPAITSVNTTLICAAKKGVKIEIIGTGFVKVDDEDPNVLFNGEDANKVNATDCDDYDVGYGQVSFCKNMVVTLNKHLADSIEPIELSITSSDGKCESVFDDLVYYAPVPVLESVEPQHLCHSDNAQNITIHGQFVVPKDNAQISVDIGNETTSPNVYLESCTEGTVGNLAILTCTELLAEVPPDTRYGPLAITVTAGCSAKLSAGNFTHVPIPSISSMSQNTLCAVALNTVEIVGENFVALNNSAVVPSVIFGKDIQAENVTVDDCEGTKAFKICKKLSFIINGASFTDTKTSFTIFNTDSKCTGSNATKTMPVAGVPTVTDYDKNMCEGGGIVNVVGSDFRSDALEFILESQDHQQFPANLSKITNSSFTATYTGDVLAPGTYTVIIRSAPQAECTAQVPSTVSVTKNELAVIDVEPSTVVAPGGRQQSVVLTARAFDAIPVYIHLVSDKRTLVYTNENITIDNNDYNRFFLNLPTDLEAGQTFNASLRAVTTCMTSADNLFQVAEKKTGDVSGVEPSVISNRLDTIITVTVPTTLTSDDVLSVMAASNNTVYTLSDPRWVSATQVSARVPASLLKSGKYMIYVTKTTTGEYWSLDCAITVSDFLPISVSEVKPSLIPTTAGTQVIVTGSNFATGRMYASSLRCKGQVTIQATQTTATSDTSLTISLPAISVDHSSCLLVIEDQTSGFSVVYNGIAIASDDTRPGTYFEDKFLLPTPLCGSSAVSASIGEDKFIYLIGGDSDVDCGGKSPVSTVYYAELDNNKDDSSLITTAGWMQANKLPFPVAFAQAQVIDTYIYITGGYDSTAARNSVLRAQILQPDDAPKLNGMMHADVQGKLPVGHYLYAVTAVYKPDDPINPNGQSLASNVVSLNVALETGTPYLKWNSIDDGSITSYRVFRANLADGKFQKIADVTTNEFVDLGTATPSDGEPPAVGTLGNWATLSDNAMSFARCGHVSTTLNPSGNDKLHYLFSFGGAPTTPSTKSVALDSYESVRITMTPAVPGGVRQSHRVELWQNGTYVTNGQHLWSGVMLDASNVGYSGYQAIVLGPGAENLTEHQWNYAQNNDVFVNSAFIQLDYTTSFQKAFGYCLFAHDNTLVMAGGSNNIETLEAIKAIQVMILDPQTPPNPLTNYTGKSDLTMATVYPACTRVGGYLVVIGGRSTKGPVDYIQFIPG